MASGIYCITDKEGRRYIGKSKNLENRIRQHLSTRFRGCEVTILQECPVEELSDLEWEWCYRVKPELNVCVARCAEIRGEISKWWDNTGASKYWENKRDRRARGENHEL
jgi:hypothetical protein